MPALFSNGDDSSSTMGRFCFRDEAEKLTSTKSKKKKQNLEELPTAASPCPEFLVPLSSSSSPQQKCLRAKWQRGNARAK